MTNSHRTPTVSICLPVWNGEAFLRQAVESALAQTFSDFELLISDDCSEDGSAEIIAQYAKQDKRIIWWQNKARLGLCANYNSCMERASGIYVKPFAQDDLWATQLLSRQVNFLSAHEEVALVAAQRVLIDKLGEPLPYHLQFTNITDVLGVQLVYPFYQVVKACLGNSINNLIGEPCAVMFRKSFQGAGFSTIFKHVGDLEYWLRILKDGHFGMVNEPLVYFRKHSGAATAVNVTRLFVYSDIVHLADAIIDVLPQINCSKEEFIKKNIAALAKTLTKQFKAAFDLNAIDGDDDYNQADVAALKRAFITILALLNDSNQGSSIAITSSIPSTQRLLFKVRNSERQLEGLLRSRSWQLTRPLRELNKLVPRYKAMTRTTEKVEVKDNVVVTPESQQLHYLEHLEQQIEHILTSRSWHYTRFLRRRNSLDDDEKLAQNSLLKPEQNACTTSSTIEQSDVSSLVYLPLEEQTTAPINALSREQLIRLDNSSNRPYDLILAIHDATRSGAPMLGLALAKGFVARGLNCLVVLKSSGELTHEFVSFCDVLNLSGLKDKAYSLEQALKQLVSSNALARETPVVLNSAELHELSGIFHRAGCRVITLIHEFLSTYPQAAREGLLSNSAINIFSSQSTFNDAIQSCLTIGNACVIPQGLLEPNFGTMNHIAGKEFLHKRYGIDSSSFVVLSCGKAILRKGIDIFCQVARRILVDTPEKVNIHFIWIGDDTPVKHNVLWWSKADLRKYGIEQLVHFVGPQSELEPFFVAADVFLLPSRQDPLPCVVHLAQAASIPSVAFLDSGGTEEMLSEGGGKLVPYGNVASMSDAVLSYYYDEALRATDGAKARAIVSSKYRINDYVDTLLKLIANLQDDCISSCAINASTKPHEFDRDAQTVLAGQGDRSLQVV